MDKVGQNVQAEVKGDMLTLTVKLSEKRTPSRSGKSEVIGTTSGNQVISYNGASVWVGLNVYRKR